MMANGKEGVFSVNRRATCMNSVSVAGCIMTVKAHGRPETLMEMGGEQ